MNDKKENTSRISIIKNICSTNPSNNDANSCNARLTQSDCENALKDLQEDSFFQPVGDTNGPYELELDIKDNRLIFHIKDKENKDLPLLILSLNPYKNLIKDYFIIINSYCTATSEGKQCRLEAIDMGRRGIHNEGAELLKERLKDKITLDTDTARRLFTLICTLQRCKTHMLH